MSEIRVKLTSLVKNTDGDSIEIEVSGDCNIDSGVQLLVDTLNDAISQLTVPKDPDMIIKDLAVTEEPVVKDTPQKQSDPFICVSCGMKITKIQKDVSLLFMNTVMCDACMKSQPKQR